MDAEEICGSMTRSDGRGSAGGDQMDVDVDSDSISNSNSNLNSNSNSTCLYRAAEKNDIESARVYMTLFQDPSARNERGDTPLHCAQSAEMVQALIGEGDVHLVNAKNDRGRTPLIEATVHDRVGVTKALLIAGADATATDSGGLTALHAAEGKDMVHMLVVSGGRVNAKTEEGWTPLHLSCYKSIETTRALLDHGANIDATDRYMQSPLHFLTDTAHIELMVLVLENGANVNHRDAYGNTALHAAATQGYTLATETLLAAGANPFLANKANVSSLEVAHVHGHRDILGRMAQQGGLLFGVNTANFRGNTQLHRTASYGYDAMATALLNAGADPNVCTEQGMSPLDFAFENKHESLAKLLILRGAAVNRADSQGRKPLYRAATKGYHALVEILLAKGADAKSRANNGSSPLGAAYTNGHKDIVKLLILAGVNVNCRSSEGQTPLHIEAEDGCATMATFLLTEGANPSIRDDDDYSPLDTAVANQREGVIKTLIYFRTDVTETDSNGSTALHLAKSAGVVDILIDAGADPNAQDVQGDTPLMDSVQNTAIMHALVRRGARPNIQNDEGETALHLASRCKDNHVCEVVDLLLRAGADETILDNSGNEPLHYFEGMKGSGAKKARRILGSAPQDRRWRRRKLLLLCIRNQDLNDPPPLAAWLADLRDGHEGIFRTITAFL